MTTTAATTATTTATTTIAARHMLLPRPDSTVLTTAALCAAAQVTRGTLRLYESQGLIPPPKRSAAGYRHYPASEVLRLQAIRHLKEIGFTLKEIALLLDEREQGDLDPQRVRELAQAQVLEIDARIARLHAVRRYVAMVAEGDTDLIDDPDCNFLLDFMAAGHGTLQPAAQASSSQTNASTQD